MPKIIPELRESILMAARKSLLETETHDLSMRQLAQQCGTAVGTVYNYFPSKEALIAEVIMPDWLKCCREMKEGAVSGADPLSAVRETAAALRRFTSRYAPVWRHYAGEQNSLASMAGRHNQVIGEIAAAVKETLLRFDLMYDDFLPEIIAEMVLSASRTEDGFRRITPVLERILR